MNNFLFLTDRWCQMRPDYGINTHEIHFFRTLAQSYPDFQIHNLFYDEAAILYSRHIDGILFNYCKAFHINYLFICFNGRSELNPSVAEIKRVKEELGVKLIICYSDTNECDLYYQKEFAGIALNVSIDYPMEHGSLLTEGVLRLWTPQPESLYFEDRQDIDVSFIGSTRYQDRFNYVNLLKEKVPGFFTTGGQREMSLSFEKYASYIRRSKISINFSKNPMEKSYSQLKGRVMEVTASRRVLLLEEKNLSTRDFFTPGLDYIEFDSEIDLIDKIEYFRNNDNERRQIAENGYNKWKNNFTARHFWQRVLENVH